MVFYEVFVYFMNFNCLFRDNIKNSCLRPEYFSENLKFNSTDMPSLLVELKRS